MNNLLVITSAYPYETSYRGIFVKEQVDCLKKYFVNITVISPLSYFPAFAIKSRYIRNIIGYSEYPCDYISDNASIYFPRYLSLPTYDACIRLRGYLNLIATKNQLHMINKDYRIIHGHFVFPAGYVGVRLKEQLHLPFVLTAHGGDIYSQPFVNKWWYHTTKTTLERSDEIITTSLRNYNLITDEFKIAPEKVHIIRNGFDETVFMPLSDPDIRVRLGLPGNRKILLSVGNLVGVKGHRYLIEALSKAIKTYKDIYCVIIGNGQLKSNLQRQIKRLGLTEYICLIDGVDHAKLNLWMNACDCFILPSEDEGLPTVIPEALACGKPILATSVGGVPEIIKNDHLGLLVKPKSSEELAAGIVKMLSKKWDQDTIASHARKNYSWTSIAAEIMAVYARLNCKGAQNYQ
jgi:glycosyltransferase involved in cell wall biosynthesis